MIDLITKNFMYVFMFFFFAANFMKLYLNIRQSQALIRNVNRIPEDFKEAFTNEEYHDSIYYAIDNLRFSRIQILFDMVAIPVFLYGGILNTINVFAMGVLKHSPIHASILMLLLVLLLSIVVTLPFKYYHTFVIEERYGFNKATKKSFFKDTLLELVVSCILFYPILLIILNIMGRFGHHWWYIGWGVFVLYTLFISLIYPVVIMPLFNKFTPLEDGELKTRILGLMNRIGFKSNGLFVMDGSKRSGHSNAFFTGLGKNKRIVFFDTILEQLSPSQIEAVLSHELGHFKRHHVIKMLLINIVFMLVLFYVVSLLIYWNEFYPSMGVAFPSYGMGLLLAMIFLQYPLFFLQPLISIMSRKHEYEADEFAAQNSSAQELIDALKKIYVANKSAPIRDSLYSFYYDSHPSSKDRIDALRRQIKA